MKLKNWGYFKTWWKKRQGTNIVPLAYGSFQSWSNQSISIRDHSRPIPAGSNLKATGNFVTVAREQSRPCSNVPIGWLSSSHATVARPLPYLFYCFLGRKLHCSLLSLSLFLLLSARTFTFWINLLIRSDLFSFLHSFIHRRYSVPSIRQWQPFLSILRNSLLVLIVFFVSHCVPLKSTIDTIR